LVIKNKLEKKTKAELKAIFAKNFNASLVDLIADDKIPDELFASIVITDDSDEDLSISPLHTKRMNRNHNTTSSTNESIVSSSNNTITTSNTTSITKLKLHSFM